MPVLTERNHLITVEGVAGAWMKFSGGDLETETEVIHTGGMAKPTPLSGISTRSDIDVTREYDAIRDQAAIRALERASIEGEERTVTVQDLNGKSEAIGSPYPYVGKLAKVGQPERDSESSTGQTWTLTIGSVNP